MKYITLLCDGMSGLTLSHLKDKTCLEFANTKTMNTLAKSSILGLVNNVPDGYKPGSDVANLSALGYDPKIYYTGRSPLEALSLGINMTNNDIAIRCNLVTLSEDENYEDKIILDHSSGKINSQEAKKLIDFINEKLGNDILNFYSGISYKHCLIHKNCKLNLGLTPPHDILGKKITRYLPKNKEFLDLQKKSYELLSKHPINIKRKEQSLNMANSIWLWGEGSKPNLENFYTKHKIKASMISAVDLLKGMAIASSMNNINVEGATGTLHTNYKGKLDATINTLLKENNDYVFLHFEGPDECGHSGDIEGKIKTIEKIDSKVLEPLLKALIDAKQDYSILILPDHPTPIALRTHTNEAVPFLFFSTKNNIKTKFFEFNEKTASSSGIYIKDGYKLINHLFKQNFDFSEYLTK